MGCCNKTMPPAVGTKLKLNVTATFNDNRDLTLKNVDFDIVVYTGHNSRTYTKDELIPEDDNNYIVLVDTDEVGAGEYHMKLVARIPDADFADGIRTEVVRFPTGVRVIN